MEVTAAERTTIYTNISPLAQRVNNYIQTQHSSIAAVAKDIGYSRTTVSRYLTGKYDSNPNDLESKLTDFLTRQTGEAVDLTTPLAKSEGKTWQTPAFFESRDAKAVLGVCQSCQEYIGLGIVVARSGYGKTYPLLKNFPASEKFSLCQEIKQSCYKLIRAAVMANNLTNVNRRLMWLDEADAEKTLLLVLLGVAKNQKYITQKKLLELQGKLEEIGRIIGGLQKFFINNRK